MNQKHNFKSKMADEEKVVNVKVWENPGMTFGQNKMCAKYINGTATNAEIASSANTRTSSAAETRAVDMGRTGAAMAAQAQAQAPVGRWAALLLQPAPRSKAIGAAQ